jgi:hypothetical protein
VESWEGTCRGGFSLVRFDISGLFVGSGWMEFIRFLQSGRGATFGLWERGMGWDWEDTCIYVHLQCIHMPLLAPSRDPYSGSLLF